MTSTRLPGKVLAEIGGRPALAYMIERVRRAKSIPRIVVATTTNATDDPIVQLCRTLSIEVFRGSEQDVLGRFVGAARAVNAATIIRLTADCPVIDPKLCDMVVGQFQGGSYDYVSNTVERTYPDGLDTEVFSRAALEDAATHATHPYQREHVTPYMYGAPSEARVGALRWGQHRFRSDFSHVRWTLDTADDLARIRTLVSRLSPEFDWLEALAAATRPPTLLGAPQ